MAFCKIKTDVFANAKIRRISDGSFRIWIYLLTQAWEESPNKKAGSISIKGVSLPPCDDGDAHSKLRERYGRMLYSAAGCTENEGWVGLMYAAFINELENVALIDVEENLAGDLVPTRPGDKSGTVWDIAIQMHDWDYHNPRVPPSHTPEGEAERKRKYRELKRLEALASQGKVPSGPKARVPSVPTLDQDQDKDPNQDQDLPSTEGRLGQELKLRLEAGLGRGLIPLKNGQHRRLESILVADGGTDPAYAFIAATCREQNTEPKSMAWVVKVLGEARP
jgi:hypothetical protein